MNESKQKQTQKIIHILNIIGIILTIWLMYWCWKSGMLTDQEKLYKAIKNLGIWGPVVFFIIQIAQTVVPVMPGAVTIPIGILAFGNIGGFFLNLIPIYIGSAINFWIARRYGKPTVRAILGDKSYNSMLHWFETRKLANRLFTFLMFVPFSPADILCYGAGITNMSKKYFGYSLLFGKPVSLAIYGYATVIVLKTSVSFF